MAAGHPEEAESAEIRRRTAFSTAADALQYDGGRPGCGVVGNFSRRAYAE